MEDEPSNHVDSSGTLSHEKADDEIQVGRDTLHSHVLVLWSHD